MRAWDVYGIKVRVENATYLDKHMPQCQSSNVDGLGVEPGPPK